MNVKDFYFKNIGIGLNYGTTETTEEDVIYIETDGKYSGDSNIIAVTVEEAEMISKELMKFVNLFKQ